MERSISETERSLQVSLLPPPPILPGVKPICANWDVDHADPPSSGA